MQRPYDSRQRKMKSESGPFFKRSLTKGHNRKHSRDRFQGN